MSGAAIVPLHVLEPSDRWSDRPRPVGFARMGDQMPETVAEVLFRIGTAARRAREIEQERRSRAGAIAEHVRRELAYFAGSISDAGSVGPVTVRVTDGENGARHADQLHTWPVLHWRTEGFPKPPRPLHLFVDSRGNTFEGPKEPGPFQVRDLFVPVVPVDVPASIAGMAEIDARRHVGWIVVHLAEHLRDAGVLL